MSRVLRVPCGDVNCHLVQGAQGAVLVDTTHLDLEESFHALLETVKKELEA